MRLWPAAPPPAYVELVSRHVTVLRDRAYREAGGDAQVAEQLSQQLLVDIAAGWPFFARYPDTVDRYLTRTLARRARRWRDEQIYPVDVVVGFVKAPPAVVARKRRSSAALRLAPVLGHDRPGPTTDAAVAWCHGYALVRRTLIVTRVVLATTLFFGAILLLDALTRTG